MSHTRLDHHTDLQLIRELHRLEQQRGHPSTMARGAVRFRFTSLSPEARKEVRRRIAELKIGL